VTNDSAALSPLDYLRPVWRFKWLVLLLIAAAVAGTYVYYAHKPKVFETSTELYVGTSQLETLLQQFNNQSPTSIADDARLVTTPQVAARVAQDLHLDVSPDALLGSVTATSAGTTDFLVIGAQASSPALAANLANGFAHAYLEVAAANYTATARGAVTQIERQLGRLSGASNTLKRAALQTLLGQVIAQASLSPQIGQQEAPAVAPVSPSSPKPVRNAIFAGALALLMGLIASYAFDRSDTRLRRLDDFERLLGLPVLASIPRVRHASPSANEMTAVPQTLREPYRTLRVNVDMIRAKEGLRTLMITSALPSEGKTTTVRNLALAYREAGLSVAIIEGDMRRPMLAELFGVPGDRGLSEILETGADASSALVTVAGAGRAARIDLLPAGKPSDNPAAHLHPEAFRAIRNQLLVDHALVLIDSPPILAVSDALIMAAQVDGVIFVVRAAVSTDATTKRLRRTFDQISGAKLVGTVANAVSDELGVDAYRYYYGMPQTDAYAPLSDEGKNGGPSSNGNTYESLESKPSPGQS
jgi:capsular exopolysaccharide synthesis family protein